MMFYDYSYAISRWQYPDAPSPEHPYKGLLIGYCPNCDLQLNYTAGDKNCTFIAETGYYTRDVYVKCNCGEYVTYGG